MREGIVSLILNWALACSAATIYVDLDAPNDPGPGDPAVSDPMEDGSQEHPFDEIQEGIDAAQGGDTVLVASGLYVITESINFNRLHDPEDPASPPLKNITLRSEAGPAATVIQMHETRRESDMSAVMLFTSGESGDSVVEGLTITGDMNSWLGGGVYCGGSSPRLHDCRIVNNSAGCGGGMYCCEDASPTLTDCTISENGAEEAGGVYCSNASPRLERCTISSNITDIGGGGINCRGESAPILTDCTISSNSGIEAGGVQCWDSASPTLTNCIIWGNGGLGSGGVTCAGDSSPTLTRCTISHNQGFHGGLTCSQTSSPTLIECTIVRNGTIGWSGRPNGGGIACMDGSSPRLERCTIWGNAADGYGGGLSSCSGATPVLTNCTIAENSAPEGGGLFCSGSYPSMTSCIVWGNTGGSIALGEDEAEPQVSFSCIEGDEKWPGEGNINDDPLFCRWDRPEVDVKTQSEFEDALTGYFSISLQSPCLGAGRDGSDMGATRGACEASGSDGRLIRLSTGTFSVEGLDLSLNVSIEGASQGETTINGTVYGLRTGASLSHATVIGGTEGGIRVGHGETPVITDCTVTGNSVRWGAGGGICCGGTSAPAISNCTISENTAEAGGGVYCSQDSSPVMTNCTITGNTTRYGGGIYCGKGSSPVMSNCTVSGNLAAQGGGLWLDDCSILMTNCIVWNNAGGSMSFTDNGGERQISFSCIESNEPVPGEGNINVDPRFCGWDGHERRVTDQREFEEALTGFSLSLSAQSPCLGTGKEGANMGADAGTCAGSGENARSILLSAGTFNMDGLNLTNNVTVEGVGEEETVLTGAVRSLRTGATISHVTVRRGGIYIAYGEAPQLAHCTYTDNYSPVTCEAGSSPLLTNCTIVRNSGTGVYCYDSSTPELLNCTISENSGTGVYCFDSSTPELLNCTISENSRGGIACQSGSSPVLSSCTISGNWGSGLYCRSGSSPEILNCIVWGNAGGSTVVDGADEPPHISFSCIESDELVPGEGNINSDPRFCGWDGHEVIVNSQSEFEDALTGFSLSLSAQSPCRGTGKGGADMGAETGICAGPGESTRSLILSTGTYSIEGLDLIFNVSIQGAGRERTVIEGTIRGLRTGASLSDLTVTEGTEGGIRVEHGEAPEITGCTISGNSAGWFCGGGVYCGGDSTPALTNCTIVDNLTYSSGGGVCCEGEASPVLSNCAIVANSASNGGGICCRQNASPVILDCDISGNSAGRGGGVSCIHNSSPRLTNCTISRNSTGYRGGGVSCTWHSSPVMTHCTIAGNSATRRGGGIHCANESSPEVLNCIVWSNAGGSIYLEGDDVSPHISFSCIESDELVPGEGNIITDPQFCGWDGNEIRVTNQSEFAEALSGFDLSLSTQSPCLGAGKGGAAMGAPTGTCAGPSESARLVLLSAGTYAVEGLNLVFDVSIEGAGEKVTVIAGTIDGLRTGSSLSNLTVAEGTEGGIRVGYGEAPHITDCTITGNRGGGISCYGGSPVLTHCVISGNIDGGTNFAGDSSPVMTRCAISENSAHNGGGIYCTGSTPRISDCTILGNSAIESGGGVCCYESSPVLTNCILSGNSAALSRGGAISCNRGSPVLRHCTVTGNSAIQVGGGVYCDRSSPVITSCIFWANMGGSISLSGNEAEPQVSFSCIEDDATWPGEGNINADPIFVQPGHWDDNGTPADASDDIWIEGDYHLQPGSPAIDGGTSEGAPTTDIEGNGRPCGAGVDIGAYEMGGCSPPPETFVRGDSNSDGTLDIADPIYTLLYAFAGGTAPTCLDTADSNDDGAIDVADAIFVLQYLFVEGPMIPLPYPDCGIDPTVDELGCERYPTCEDR